jgi:hypothetical protein
LKFLTRQFDGLVPVKAKHVVAQVSQAGACDKAYVAGSDDGDVHDGLIFG